MMTRYNQYLNKKLVLSTTQIKYGVYKGGREKSKREWRKKLKRLDV